MPPIVDTSQPQPMAPQGKYPANVGKRYWGEFPGYTYDPYSDAYYPDRSVYEDYQENSGLAPEKPRTPSAWEGLVPLGALAGTTWALSDSGRNAISGWFGGGEAAAQGAADAALSAGGGSAVGGGAGGGALMELGASGAPATPNVISATQVAPEAAAGIGYAPYLGLAGAGLGAYGLYQGIKEGSPMQGGMGGAALGGGLAAAAPLLGFGPLGWAGLGIGALAGGLGGAGLASLFGDKEMWKTEQNRLKDLQEEGAFIPQEILASMPSKGRSTQELVDIEKQNIAAGRHGNVEFAKSRKESDLTGADIAGYSAFVENDPNWFNRPLPERLAYAQRALDSGAVREHHGTIDVDFNKISEAPPTAAPIAPAPPAPTSGAFGQPIMQPMPAGTPSVFNNITPPGAVPGKPPPVVMPPPKVVDPKKTITKKEVLY